MDFETEEQQLEAIKKWWNENKTMLVTGVAVGVAAIFGWQTYQQKTITHSEKASVLYEQVMTNSQNASKLNEQMTAVNELEAEYSDTPYASLTALVLAKQQMDAGDVVKAQQQLQWVVDNTQQDELKYLAKIRLARLLLSTQQVEQAISIVSEAYPDSFKAMSLELKGDALLVQGKKELAKEAYNQAVSMSEKSNQWLQLKIDDIGSVSKAAPESAETPEPSA